MKDADKTQYFILKEHVSIIYKQSQEKPHYQYFFNYIISQKTDQKDFQNEFPSMFNQIMTENQGWKKICSNIYDIIQKQFQETQSNQSTLQQKSSNVFQIISMDENVTQYNRQLFQGIIKKVENQLEQINKELAFYGIEFSQLFIRKLQFYSFFIIWRFICYDKYQMYKKEQQIFLDNKAIVQNKYENAILRNQKKESQNQGEQQAKIIYKLCIMQFYKEKKNNVSELINQNKKTSFQLIKELDQQLLIRKENIIKVEHFETSIIGYLIDQREFIQKYIEQLVSNLQNDIKIQLDIQPYIQDSLTLIKNNAKIIFDRCKILLNSQIQQPSDFIYGYENHNISLKQTLKYILGQKAEKVEINLHKQIFLDDESIKIFNLPIEQILQTDTIPLQFFDTFLEEFIKQLSILIEESKKLETQVDEFQLKGQFEELKNTMNGCDQSCPTCNRKCDSEFYYADHKHKCTNGHQLRGLKKILIRNSPSLFTCEEIVDDAEIQIVETCKIKTWREIKAYYKNWSFMDILKTEELQQNKQKMIEIWNGGIGQQMCQKLSQDLKYEIRYQQKHDLPMQQQHSSTHFIFILDDSGSMEKNWKCVINCVESQFQQISRKRNARVSVVIFNNTARVVLKCEELRIEEQLKLITYQNGGTKYGPAFQKTLELIKENTEYDNTVILFYTDGLAEYPTKEIEQFGKISKRMKDTISFLACSLPTKSPSLEQILTFCKKEFTYSEWRDKIEPSNLNKNWTEMISQAHLDKYKA
ncbi:unnamed protein product [Paramecium octaurelia]|uniref:VWFA domain-containing protein n=1 Tax=Paramecium octaurelia TaxID=43137 RepID=A0A8S1WF29_PAROT|nr:unnamed protein product [Paramecium octaurelia]